MVCTAVDVVSEYFFCSCVYIHVYTRTHVHAFNTVYQCGSEIVILCLAQQAYVWGCEITFEVMTQRR